MSVSTANLSALRQLLADRFPQATRPVARVLPTGLPAIDDAVGGLPRHALTELVCPAPSVGSHLFMAQLLGTTRTDCARVALIDATDCFDPQSIPPEDLQHVVWVRCCSFAQVMPVADLLAREANLDLVLLDLVASALSSLRRIPATTWYRLQRAVEQTDLAFVALTPATLVPSAQLRLTLERPHTLASRLHPRPQLTHELPLQLQRQRRIAASG